MPTFQPPKQGNDKRNGGRQSTNHRRADPVRDDVEVLSVETVPLEVDVAS